jgi:cytosine/adenosine deaminase-related metal-dependent hydrolase
VVEPDCSALAGRQDLVGPIQVGKRADLVLLALDEVTTALCGPDGAAVVNYGGLSRPSTRCSSTTAG